MLKKIFNSKVPFTISIIVNLFIFTQALLSQNASTEKDRKSISITIYNGGVGLVREIRNVNINKGRTSLKYKDVASSILPPTVRVKPLSNLTFDIFEQNYEYDLISNQRLLEKYIGKELTLVSTNEKTGEEIREKATLIAYNDGPIYKIQNQISLGHPGRVLIPSLPQNLFAKPTLIWELNSDASGSREMEVSYQTSGLDWSADYNIYLSDSEKSCDVQSWVTLSNSSGMTYENATLQLVAGKVQLITNQTMPQRYVSKKSSVYMESTVDAAPGFEQENLSEYYLYTLDKPTTIRDKQTKQVQLFSENKIKVNKKYIFENMPLMSKESKYFTNATVRYDIENSQKNKLGRPLPSGTIRIFKADKKNRVQLLGEDRIDHTPKDEWVRVSTGKAFDVVGNLIQTDYQKFKVTDGYKTSYEGNFRNKKNEDITIRFYFNVSGEWEISKNNIKYEKESQRRIYFEMKIPANGSQKLEFTVENAT